MARFESVLLLDSDNFPIRDPTYLFDTAEFQETGAIFWPDFWYPQRTMFHVDRDSMLWELTGIKYVDMFEQESGQLLVNRTMHERALHIMMYYSKPSNLIWRWNLVWGDKDLYRLAWMRAGEAFHMIRTPAGSAGQVSGPYFCGQTMVQHDPQGRPVFFHRNTYKLGPGSTHRVWDAYLRFVGDDPLQQYSVDVWSGPSHRLRFLSNVCFGQREPATAKHWALQPIAEMAEVADLEWKMISFVEELGGEGNQ
jgi:alpha 1,2-mannosyltransferase